MNCDAQFRVRTCFAASRARLANALLAVVWFTCSASLALFNKLLLGADNSRFPAPLLMTAVQFSFQFLFAGLVVFASQTTLPRLPMRTFILQVAPSALAFALDIGLSNSSLVYLTVSFYTMCKSSAPMFLLCFAFLLGLEAPSLQLGLIVMVICGGVLLTVAGETHFHILGFLLVVAASCMSGLRWALSQVVLQKAALGLEKPQAAMVYMMPLMALCLAVISWINEDPVHLFQDSPFFDNFTHAAVTTGLIAAGAMLATLMTLAEFQLLHNTSAMTLMVLGMCKEVGTIAVSAAFYGDTLGPSNISGMLLVLVGVGMYNEFRRSSHENKDVNTPESGSYSDVACTREHPIKVDLAMDADCELTPLTSSNMIDAACT